MQLCTHEIPFQLRGREVPKLMHEQPQTRASTSIPALEVRWSYGLDAIEKQLSGYVSAGNGTRI